MLSRIQSVGYITSGSFTSPISRLLHIEKQFLVADSQEKIKAIILKTCSDKIPKEPSESYIERSLLALAENVPMDLQNKPLLMFKVNQSVIDSHVLQEKGEVKPLFQGHALCCLSRITQDTVEVLPQTLVSKVPLPETFEEQRSLIENSSHRLQKAEETGSGEYFILAELEKMQLSIETYQQNCENLLRENEPYDLLSNACGHAIYEACIGKPLKKEKLSAQQATFNTIEKILSNNEDKIFTERFESAIKKSGFSIRANEIHAQLVEQPCSTKQLAEKR